MCIDDIKRFNTYLAQALQTYQDTARYLMNEIEGKKSQYIGKPFSVLYDSLKVKPVDWTANVASKIDFGENLRIYFNNEEEFEKKHILIVDFESVPPYNTLYQVFFPAPDLFGLIDSVVQVYKPLIVKDVVTKDYYEEPDWEPALQTNTPVESNTAITAQQKSIIQNLDKYMGKPFSVLRNDLSIKPQTVQGNSCLDGSRECTTIFYYQTPVSKQPEEVKELKKSNKN